MQHDGWTKHEAFCIEVEIGFTFFNIQNRGQAGQKGIVRLNSLISLKCLAALLLMIAWACIGFPQTGPKDRLSERIENASTSRLLGTLHRLAQPQYDQGEVGSLFTVGRVTMIFKSTAAQQADLDKLLREQQDPSSQNYHKWLTPEEFADRFGLSSTDMDKVTSWLQAQGLTVDETARSRRWITFTGFAQQIETAFYTQIHNYVINGESYYANATEPSVPEALGDVVLGFRSLNNFRLKPRLKSRRVQFTSSVTGHHYLAPDDFAAIYDIKSLYDSGVDGTGQKLAVMGQSDIQVSDIRAFRNASGLSPNDPQIILVPGSSDPGIVTGDVDEADLDLEWAGAIARNATLIYVNSANGVPDSLQYAIDQNLAPVVSTSYGDCESNFTQSDINALVALTQQANAQGITVVGPAGDAGAADCDGDFAGRRVARLGLAVDIPASLPYVTGVGGTTLNDLGTTWNSAGQSFSVFFGKGGQGYWDSNNNSSNSSALSYVPETAWNDTLVDGVLDTSGGGRSIYFSKPSWQIGNGVPNDGRRDVPDVSLAASASHDGYLSCSQGSCINGFRGSDNSLNIVGGTSLDAPAFAGIVALINQKTNSIQGNANPALYRLAATVPGIFHDVTDGGNQVPCRAGTQDCPSTGFMGYTAGNGYDLATGLGSVDVSRLVNAWVSSVMSDSPHN